MSLDQLRIFSELQGTVVSFDHLGGDQRTRYIGVLADVADDFIHFTEVVDENRVSTNSPVEQNVIYVSHLVDDIRPFKSGWWKANKYEAAVASERARLKRFEEASRTTTSG